jgi:hypothetical protein
MRNPNTYKPERRGRVKEAKKSRKKWIGRWKDSKAIRKIQRTLDKKAKMMRKRRRGKETLISEEQDLQQQQQRKREFEAKKERTKLDAELPHCVCLVCSVCIFPPFMSAGT